MLMISNQCMTHYRRSIAAAAASREVAITWPSVFAFRFAIMAATHLSRIGTPLSPSATKVMLLGAGELGKEVIIALQRFGVEVIAVDRYANAPGMQVAHRSHVIAMTDAAAQLTMNREGIRRLAAEELGLPTSRHAFANSLAELQAAIDAGIGYPCVVKPVMSSSGKGQSVLRVPSDVEKAWNYALESGRVKEARVIVEAFVDFEYEITQLTVRAIGVSGQVETFFCEPIGHVQVAGDYVESWQPQAMSPLALQRSREVAEKVTGALGGRGIFGVELFVKGDEVWFSEVSPSPHDTGLVTGVAAPLRVRTARACHSRVAGGYLIASAGRLGGHLRWHGGAGHRFRGRGACPRRARVGSAAIRQAGKLRQAAHGCRRGERRHDRRGAGAGKTCCFTRQACQIWLKTCAGSRCLARPYCWPVARRRNSGRMRPKRTARPWPSSSRNRPVRPIRRHRCAEDREAAQRFATRGCRPASADFSFS
jgi:phosphoribosylglycinamide formyltransferase 2